MISSISLVILALFTSEPAPPSADGPAVDRVWPAAERVVGKDEVAPVERGAPGGVVQEVGAEATLARMEEQERSWTAQLARTLLALLVVLGLIYLVFKVVAPRLLGLSLPARSGKRLKVLERIQLDARHAVAILEVEETRRLLVATGEHGVQLLTDLSRPEGTTRSPRTEFRDLLERPKSGADEEP